MRIRAFAVFFAAGSLALACSGESRTDAGRLDSPAIDSGSTDTVDAGARDVAGLDTPPDRDTTVAADASVDSAPMSPIAITLTLDRSSVAAGGTVQGTASFRNVSTSPVAIRRAIVTVRRPGATHAGGPYDDFAPTLGATTIDPSAVAPLIATRAFTTADPAGDWDAYATYESDTGWVDGPSVRLVVEPAAGPAPIALGSWIPGAPADPSQIDAFTTLVGAAPAVVHWYQSWARFPDFTAARFDAVVAHGAVPMITWEPWDTSAGVTQPSYALRTIAAGDHDTYIHQWARAAAAWGGSLYLRFAHEMNGNWYPWAIGVNGNTAADYIAAWRHVHDLFVADGATNVRWVWCPNVAYTGSTPFASIYPGDAYVDWTGLDGYNPGTSRPGGTWRALRDVFAASHDALAALSPRPLMIAETSSAEEGGDKGAWIRTGLLTDLPVALPRVRAVVWFDELKEADWRVNSSAGSLAAFREVAASPIYSGRL